MTGARRADRTLALAAQVATVAAARGVETAVIGAVAMAVHGYVRDTADVDLATVTDPSTTLAAIARDLASDESLQVSIALPDADDPLGGVVTVRPDDALRAILDELGE